MQLDYTIHSLPTLLGGLLGLAVPLLARRPLVWCFAGRPEILRVSWMGCMVLGYAAGIFGVCVTSVFSIMLGWGMCWGSGTLIGLHWDAERGK